MKNVIVRVLTSALTNAEDNLTRARMQVERFVRNGCTEPTNATLSRYHREVADLTDALEWVRTH